MKKFVLVAFVVCGLAAESAQAQVAVYSNLGTNTGGSQIVTTTTAQGAVQISGMISDDLFLDPLSGGLPVTQISFSVFNSDAAAFTARPRVRFFANDNGGNAPGTFLAGFSFNPVNIPAGTATTFTGNLGAGLNIPLNAQMWAGMLFDNLAPSTATAAQVAALGMGIFSGPTVGSSTTAWFDSPAPASGSYLSSNPTGTLMNLPADSFGWAIRVAAVPEPTSMTLMGLAVAGYGIRRWKGKK